MSIVTKSVSRTVVDMDNIEAAILEFVQARGFERHEDTKVELNIETSPTGEVVSISAVLVTEIETILSGELPSESMPSVDEILNGENQDRVPREDPNSDGQGRGDSPSHGLGR